ncbi:MAG: hypothetical protein ABW185_14505 [Sedimenticola sp.]
MIHRSGAAVNPLHSILSGSLGGGSSPLSTPLSRAEWGLDVP